MKKVLGMFLCMVLLVTGCNNSTEEQEQVITKLESFTEKEENNDSYIFSYVDENEDNNSWSIKYMEANDFVIIYDENIADFFLMIDGQNTIADESSMSYDFDENEVRIYFDENLADISILSYNIETEEYTVNQDGERYEISKEFKIILEENGFVKLVQKNLDLFEKNLKDNGLNLEDIKKITFSDLN